MALATDRRSTVTDRVGTPSTAGSAGSDPVTWRATVALILLAYCFAMSMRFAWIHYANSQPSFQWNGHAITNNRDSFLFGCILQKARFAMHQENSMVPGVLHHGAITAVPYLLLKTTPLTINGLLLYAPVFVAPLIVVPLVLIGRLGGSTAWGFLAALVGGIGHSYYTRTLAGYFDTDMVSVTVPTVALACLMTASRRSSLPWSLAAAMTLFLYPFFYYPGIPIGYGLGLTYVAFRAVVDPRGVFTWQSSILVLGGIGLCRFTQGSQLERSAWPAVLAAVALVGTHVVFRTVSIRPRTWLLLGIATLVGFVAVASPWQVVVEPFRALRQPAAPTAVASHRRSNDAAGQPARHGAEATGSRPRPRSNLKFLNALSTVREVGRRPIGVLAVRIAGSRWAALLAVFGYAVACWRCREMLLALPLVGMAVVAYFTGLRFTVFVVPVAALGTVGGVFELAHRCRIAVDRYLPDTGAQGRDQDRQSGKQRNRRVARPPRPTGPSGITRPAAAHTRPLAHAVRWAVIGLGTLAIAWPNLQHLVGYKIPAVLTHDAVAVLDAIRRDANPRDYIITWWDYGSAVWYYTGCRTLNSPGNNNSPDNYLVSEILATTSQRQAANLCREAVEQFEASAWTRRGKRRRPRSAIVTMLRDPRFHGNPKQLLAATSSDTFVPAKATRRVYLFLPGQLLAMYPAIRRFSNRDLVTGQAGPPLLYQSLPVLQADRTHIVTVGGLRVDVAARTASIRGRLVRVHALHVSAVDKQGRLKTQTIPFAQDASNHLIFVPDKRFLLLVDEATFRSALIQMFLFEHHDPAYFNPVRMNREAKGFRVRE